MNLPEQDLIRLWHIVEYAEMALRFVEGRSREDLDENEQLALATVKALENVGEAAYQIAQTTRELFPDVPWRRIISMRHRLVHVYHDIDYDVIFSTATANAKELISIFKPLLETMPRPRQ